MQSEFGGYKHTCGLETGVPFSLMLLEVVVEAIYDGLTKRLGLLALLRKVSTGRVVSSPQHGAASIKELGEKLPHVISEQISQSAGRVYPVVQDRVGDNGGSVGLEGYKAKILRDQVSDHQHKLVSALSLE